jgi:dienelactone hydrolase
MNTYIFHPDGPDPHPVVIHYMDSVGVREELSDMCRRLASVGYCVLMLNLHYRKVRHVDLDADRLRDLEAENARLKKAVAESHRQMPSEHSARSTSSP